jgi:endonuclease/exonuclease/phosphatase family metal-dependent hydrolase
MNVWGKRGDWDTRRRQLTALLTRLDPDLLCLQETIVGEHEDQVRELLGDRLDIAHSSAREKDGQGISTACRWPITALRELDLQLGPRTADFAATTLIAKVAAPTGPVLLVNHFPSWKPSMEAERCTQTVLAARAVEEMRPDPAAPVVVAGDLDADPDSTSIRFWTGRHPLDGISVCYRDAWAAVHPDRPGHTYTPDNPLLVDDDWPFRRIDYVLVRFGEHGPSLRIRDCRIVGDDPAVSDHYGVLADLDVL